jgi:hypothetical protein
MVTDATTPPERIAELEHALRATAAILQAEQRRQGGKPFSGTWTIPAYGISMTVSECLDLANETLSPLPTPPEARP